MMSSGTVSWLKNKAKGKADHDEDGVLKMTPATVKYLCMDHDGYDCEEINDKLYLHFQGFKEIGGLEAYTGLKCLFLESNAITQVNGLSHLSSLRSLYLQQNVIKQIRSPAFKGLSNLVTLDISQNMVQSLEGIEELVSLRTLNASKNYLAEAQSLASLHQLTNLTSVDLKSNKLESEDVLDSVMELTRITALYLSGNPLVRNTKHYRKRLIAKLPQLTYLDERPVDEKEIVLAQAWASGGQDAEATAREAWLKQDREKIAAKHHSWTLFKQEVELKRQSEIDEAAAQGKPPPAPKRFVSYQSNVIESEEKQLQALIGEPSPAASCCNEGTEAEDPTGQAQQLSSTASKCNNSEEGATAQRDSEPSKVSKVLKDACPSNKLGTGAEITPQDAVESAKSVQVHKTSSPSVAAQHDKRVDESFRIYTERKRLAALKREKAQEKQEKHNQAGSAEKKNAKTKVFTDATKKDLESSKALKSPKVNETSSGPKSTEPPLNAGVEPRLVPLNIIQDAVVEFKYNFTKASAHIKKITGVEVSPEDCRQQFVKARRSKASQKNGTKCVPLGSGGANTGKDNVEALLASGQELVQSTRVEEQVMGRPMPKVGVKPPACLPSVVDLESDDGGSLSPTSERDPEDLSSCAGPECDENDDDSPNVFDTRLTRQTILESLHGSNNHPLAVDDTNLDELL